MCGHANSQPIQDTREIVKIQILTFKRLEFLLFFIKNLLKLWVTDAEIRVKLIMIFSFIHVVYLNKNNTYLSHLTRYYTFKFTILSDQQSTNLFTVAATYNLSELT